MAAPPASHVARFEEFVVDLRTGELFKNGKKIRLQVQPFQVLALLVRRPGELVSRDELRDKLWPDNTFVDFDDGLNTAVRKLRQVLRDSADHPQYIETLPRRGYRFVAPVTTASPPQAEPAVSVSERVIEDPDAAGRDARVTEGPAVSRAHGGWMLGATAVLVGLGVWLGAGSLRERLLPRGTPVHIRSIAVLPLENLSGDPAQEFFTDGMTDAVVTELAQISSLRVISRTSVMRYKGTRTPLPDIARELNVDGIVTGAVVQSTGRVRVDAQLVEATTDRHLWATTYERNLEDVVTLQSEVARAIATAIHVQLTPHEQVRLAARQSVDPQAYEFYLKGRYFWEKRTAASARTSIEYFQQAIQRAPNYALAYVGLANVYIQGSDLPPAEAMPRAKAAASTALQLDEGLGEAHAALALCLFWYDWDWAGAEREFQRALALTPNYAWAHQWYGVFQGAMGRGQTWAAEVKRARELDPLSRALFGGGGDDVMVARGQYDLAIEENRKRLELDPNNPRPYLNLGRVYRLKGMYEEAIVHIQKGIQLSGGGPRALSELGYTYAVSGERDKALKIAEQLTVLSTHRYVRPHQIAFVYVGLGEKDRAFDWLQKAVADRSILDALIRHKEWDSLRSDPRYSELVRRIGLPP
jgi:TolB-like protein/DNA-binding winged helix-turn-helix (wHTH) protein/tetratricopeptide (TPR) repeat protein